MAKRFFTFGILALVLFASGYWYFLSDTAAVKEAQQQIQHAVQNATNSVTPEDVAALAIKAFEMKQGEGGIQLWRLKAEWGGAQKDGDMFQLQTPKFTYFTPPDGEALHIFSETGDINQKTKVIRFVRKAEAHLGNHTLRAPLMVYNGTSKTLYFPEGIDLSNPEMKGMAPVAEWVLNDKVINASGGVDMTWMSVKNPLASGTSKEILKPEAKEKTATSGVSGNSTKR